MALGIEHGSEAAQNLPIDAIGLGQLAHAAGKIAGLARIDHRHPKTGSSQRQGQVLLVSAGGLQQHQARRQRRKHLAKLGLPGMDGSQPYEYEMCSVNHSGCSRTKRPPPCALG